jgi:hypothetical protein
LPKRRSPQFRIQKLDILRALKLANAAKRNVFLKWKYPNAACVRKPPVSICRLEEFSPTKYRKEEL